MYRFCHRSKLLCKRQNGCLKRSQSRMELQYCSDILLAVCVSKNFLMICIYKECKGKNLEIIGISLDQKPEPWKKAVKDLKMTWPQACDFQVWYGPVARRYNLTAVPYTVLINPEGKIEALNLRGEELITTIKTLLKNNKKK